MQKVLEVMNFYSRTFLCENVIKNFEKFKNTLLGCCGKALERIQ